MNKKIITAIIAASTLLSFTPQAASGVATQPPSIVIIDTAIDQTLPLFSNKIIYEVCILQTNSCPNGKSFMEGYGSAQLPYDIISKNGFDHGTQMVSVAVATNPDIKIVFIRIIGNNPDGTRQVSGQDAFNKSLEWVLKNRSRFNIQSVAMAQSIRSLSTEVNYCLDTPITQGWIQSLKSVNIPVFLPAGNSRDYTRIDWPACIPDSIAIGAVMPYLEIATYSNYDPNLLDFYALGTVQAYIPGGTKVNIAGTSPATEIASVNWATIKMAKPSLTYSEMYNLISLTSTPTFNSKITGGKLINVTGAING